MNRNRSILLVAVLLIGFFALVILQILKQNNSGTLVLTVAQKNSTVTIDGSKKASPGSISLPEGSHTIAVSADGFYTLNFPVTIARGQKIEKTVALTATAKSDKAVTLSPEEEGVTGAAVQQQGAIITANNPLITELPYIGDTFRIDVGASREHPGQNAVGIYITTYTDSGKADALDWIRSRGYDPTAYEIIYREGN